MIDKILPTILIVAMLVALFAVIYMAGSSLKPREGIKAAPTTPTATPIEQPKRRPEKLSPERRRKSVGPEREREGNG
jgi:hypothetical protein